jgi:YfiH family protein
MPSTGRKQDHAPLITSDLLTGASSVRHGFFTRQGGVSDEPYTSLNCGLGSGDDLVNVRENRARAMDRLGLTGDALRTVFQVHSSRVVTIDATALEEPRFEGDGLATRLPGVALGVLTADCAPVLFADGEAGVIGAAHAGWRGARGGVVEATVAAMVALGARRSRILAAVGPCIQQNSYEVGPEFRHSFLEHEPAAAELFAPSSRVGHHLFDLPAYVGRRVAASAVGAIEVLPFDTCGDAERFFSYRRTTLTGGGDYGRLLSCVVLTS